MADWASTQRNKLLLARGGNWGKTLPQTQCSERGNVRSTKRTGHMSKMVPHLDEEDRQARSKAWLAVS